MIFFWFMLTFAVLAPLEWWLLRQHLQPLGWWLFMTAMGWFSGIIPISFIFGALSMGTVFQFFSIRATFSSLASGAIFGLLMGFLRGLAFEPQLAQAKRVILSSIIAGALSHMLSLKIALYLVRDQEGLAEAMLFLQSEAIFLTLFYHTLNTAALILLLRDSPFPNQ